MKGVANNSKGPFPKRAITRAKARASLIALFLFICFTDPLGAEWRSYQIRKSVAQVLESFLAQMEAQKIRFSVKRVFQQSREGKQGFVLQLLPRGTFCEMAFYAKPKQKQTLIRVFTQDHKDAQLFHKLMVKKLKMKEIGGSLSRSENPVWQAKMRIKK